MLASQEVDAHLESLTIPRSDRVDADDEGEVE